MRYGVSSMVARLRVVAVRKPSSSLLNADANQWHYGSSFNPALLQSVHSQFVELLTLSGAQVISMENDDGGIADAVFTYDASLITPNGAVLMSPGKALRKGEQSAHQEFYENQNIPIVGEVSGEGTAEAGDTLWLTDDVLAIGRGFRTNAHGIAQLSDIMHTIGVTAKAFDMPYYKGREACLHLMSLISIVDDKKALVCLELVPVALLQLMQDMGYQIIAAPFDEFERSGTLSTNVLATAPGECIMLEGNPKTQAAMENAGVEVKTFNGDALCVACEGGPTCLTRPILRQA